MTKNNFKIGDRVEILIDSTQETDVGKYTCTKGMVGRVVDIQNNYLMVELPYNGDVTPILDFNFDEVKLI